MIFLFTSLHRRLILPHLSSAFTSSLSSLFDALSLSLILLRSKHFSPFLLLPSASLQLPFFFSSRTDHLKNNRNIEVRLPQFKIVSGSIKPRTEDCGQRIRNYSGLFSRRSQDSGG